MPLRGNSGTGGPTWGRRLSARASSASLDESRTHDHPSCGRRPPPLAPSVIGMTSDTGDGTDGRTWWRTALGVAAGVLTAAAVCAIFWWQGWNRPTTAAWLSSKAAVKVGFFIAAGGFASVTVWWQARRASRSTPPEEAD